MRLHICDKGLLALLADGRACWWNHHRQPVKPKILCDEEVTIIKTRKGTNIYVLVTSDNRVLVGVCFDGRILSCIVDPTSKHSQDVIAGQQIDITAVVCAGMGPSPPDQMNPITKIHISGSRIAIITDHYISQVTVGWDFFCSDVPGKLNFNRAIFRIDKNSASFYQYRLDVWGGHDRLAFLRIGSYIGYDTGTGIWRRAFDPAVEYDIQEIEQLVFCSIHSIALMKDGSVKASGDNDYKLSRSAVTVPFPKNVHVARMITFYSRLLFFLTDEGDCWFCECSRANINPRRLAALTGISECRIQPTRAVLNVFAADKFIIFQCRDESHTQSLLMIAKSNLASLILDATDYLACSTQVILNGNPSILSVKYVAPSLYVITGDGLVFYCQSLEGNPVFESIPFFGTNPIAVRDKAHRIKSAGSTVTDDD